MSDKPNYIELPLDPEYVTIEGAYMAGYIWGQHVRSEKDARQMFPGNSPLHEDFYKGAADGFNDKMRGCVEDSHSGNISLDDYRQIIEDQIKNAKETAMLDKMLNTNYSVPMYDPLDDFDIDSLYPEEDLPF